MIYFRPRVSFLSDVYDFSTTRDMSTIDPLLPTQPPTHKRKATNPQGMTFNEVATYSCNSGYKLVDNITCIYLPGRWNVV